MVLFAGVFFDTGGSGTCTATYNGVAMTAVDNQNAGDSEGKAYIFYRILGTGDATAHDIVFSFFFEGTPTQYSCVGAGISLTGIHQTTPIGTPAKASGTSSSDPSVSVTTTAGEWVVDIAACNQSGTPSFATTGTDQTERWEAGVTNSVRAAMSTALGSAGGTLSWNINPNDAWAQVAVPVKPVAEAAGRPPLSPIIF